MLKELGLSRNRLENVPKGAFNHLENLTILHYDENILKKLDNFTSLQSLTTLFLSNNRITDLKEINKLSELPYLHHLILSKVFY
jgi:Leucine-rich repeat (LRR) protein